MLTLAIPFASGALADEAPTFLLSGSVTNLTDGPVPKGILEVILEEQGMADSPARQIASVKVESDGAAQAVEFSLDVSERDVADAVDPGFTVRLIRDGRLIAANTTRQSYRRGETRLSLTIEPIIY